MAPKAPLGEVSRPLLQAGAHSHSCTHKTSSFRNGTILESRATPHDTREGSLRCHCVVKILGHSSDRDHRFDSASHVTTPMAGDTGVSVLEDAKPALR